MQAERSRPRKRRGPARPSTRRTAKLKQRLATRHGGSCCCYCGVRRKLRQMSLEHVVPLAHGGTNARSNLRLACPSCNAEKGSRLLGEWFPSSWIGGLA